MHVLNIFRSAFKINLHSVFFFASLFVLCAVLCFFFSCVCVCAFDVIELCTLHTKKCILSNQYLVIHIEFFFFSHIQKETYIINEIWIRIDGIGCVCSIEMVYTALVKMFIHVAILWITIWIDILSWIIYELNTIWWVCAFLNRLR